MVPQLLASGLSHGAIYALAAMGFVLLWQASQTINFAQGEFIMLAAFAYVAFAEVLGVGAPVAILLTLASSAIFGYLVKRGIVQPLLKRDVLTLVIATLAISLFARNAIATFWTPDAVHVHPLFPSRALHVGGAIITPEDLWIVGIVTGLIICVTLFIRKTQLGWAMQAVAQNRELATIVGISVPTVITIVYALNGLMMGAAAVLIAPVYFVQYDIGIDLGLKAFYAAIIGGFNRVQGALFGGLFVGLLETFGAVYVSSEYRDSFALVILIGILLFKPEGLFGVREE
jgi:branched-chain amino acid transport system permease protein